jgi:predicted amidophosphoribosyltransferase
MSTFSAPNASATSLLLPGPSPHGSGPSRPSRPSASGGPAASPGSTRILARALEAMLDTFAPRGCLACDAELPPVVLSRGPDGAISRSAAPRRFCLACSLSLEGGDPWAPYRYGGAVQAAIVRLKYRDRTDLAGPLGRELAQWARARAVVDTDAVVVPVASSAERVRERGYCHATLLAQAVAAELRVPVFPFGLERVRQGGTQKGRTREERLGALAGAFTASARVYGRPVLLVDDVVTTGATLDAASAALKGAGATRVQPLVVAWTAG